MSFGEGNLHERIEELESLLRGFHHCAQQGKCANCEHFAGNDGCGMSIWERYDALELTEVGR